MMKTTISILYATLFLMMFSLSLDADTVILKTGEMFHTKRAWKEQRRVKFYKNGVIVSMDEHEVERLIHTPAPVVDNLVPANPPPAGTSSPGDSGSGLHRESTMHETGDTVGYLDLRWGQSPSQIDGLTSIGTDPAYGGVAQYVRKQRKQRFGRASVDDIVLGFWQGGLYTITVWTSNFLDFRELKKEAIKRFGKGIQNRDDVEKTIWMDSISDRMLSYDFDTDRGFLWMRSRRLDIQVKARFPE